MSRKLGGSGSGPSLTTPKQTASQRIPAGLLPSRGPRGPGGSRLPLALRDGAWAQGVHSASLVPRAGDSGLRTRPPPPRVACMQPHGTLSGGRMTRSTSGRSTHASPDQCAHTDRRVQGAPWYLCELKCLGNMPALLFFQNYFGVIITINASSPKRKRDIKIVPNYMVLARFFW